MCCDTCDIGASATAAAAAAPDALLGAAAPSLKLGLCWGRDPCTHRYIERLEC